MEALHFLEKCLVTDELSITYAEDKEEKHTFTKPSIIVKGY